MPTTITTTTTVSGADGTTTTTVTEVAGGAAPTPVPADVVNAGIAAFQKAYNENDTAFCGNCYTDKCHVTVNGGADAGGFGPYTSPAEVAGFLDALRNQLGGTNIKFSVDSVEGSGHVDTWTADNGTGKCEGQWTQVDGAWKMHTDVITFTPKPAAPPVPADVVNAGIAAFQKAYNENDTAFCGNCYTDKCHVTVNGGADAGGFGPYTSPAEVAAFLDSLRNQLGGTNIKFSVDSVDGAGHVDTWTADSGTGKCEGQWIQVDGAWKMHTDVITFTPKA